MSETADKRVAADFVEGYNAHAQAADEAVTQMLSILHEKAPPMTGAHLTGAMTALVRFYLATGVIPKAEVTSQDVVKSFFPIINTQAQALLSGELK